MLAKPLYGLAFLLLMIFFLFYPGLHYRWMVWVNLGILLIIYTIHQSHYVFADMLYHYLDKEYGTPSDENKMKIKELRGVLGKAARRFHHLSIIALIIFTIFFFMN